jgi:dCMP deaminase
MRKDWDGYFMDIARAVATRSTCDRTVHAEANAIVQAASHGARIEGAGIYVTASPCWPCFKLLSNAGVIRIVFGELYRDARIYDFCKQLGIELVDMSGSTR